MRQKQLLISRSHEEKKFKEQPTIDGFFLSGKREKDISLRSNELGSGDGKKRCQILVFAQQEAEGHQEMNKFAEEKSLFF